MGYRGRRVVVSGCASGMGRATATLLLDLGAEVHGLDYQSSDLPLASFQHIDLRDAGSIRSAVGALSGSFGGLFNCAGLGPTFAPIDIYKVNFVGTRYLTNLIVPLMGSGAAVASIASTAAMGWRGRLELHRRLLCTEDFDGLVEWALAHPDELGEGYSFSKEAVVVWTLEQSQTLIRRGIRINCVLPGLTHTPMLTDQIAMKTSAATLQNVILPIGRAATPEEQAFPLVMLNSSRAGYLNGAMLNVDGGRFAALSLGQIAPPEGLHAN